MKWYYSIDGVQQGPVEVDEMRAMVASGMIHAGTLVWREGMEGWQSLGSQKEWMSQMTAPIGTPIQGYRPVSTTNGLAIASLVCGLVSLPMMASCFIGILAAIPAVICGHLALGQLKGTPGQQGRGLAIAGLVMGYLSLLLIVLMLLAMGTGVIWSSSV